MVSSYGEVWKINKSGIRKKKLTKDKDGYLRTKIHNKTEGVHRIVLSAFLGESNLTVDHKDKNKENNKLNNLEFVTQSENSKRGNNKRVLYNGNIYNSAKELSLLLGLNKCAVNVAIGKGCKVKGYYAKYL